ncbi:trypsin-like peptidase domain-containing protein [Streptomyces sp. NBC_01511]|uniref:tetratricopeptide repeat protein n=1 Tax=Streptomyces sp. NBC_01511 TaxID=2903889 RepID=UPI0038706096
MTELEATSNSSSQDGPWRVRLVEDETGTAPPLGAGVLLPGGLVLTCAHVVTAKPRRGTDGSRGAGSRDDPPRPFEQVYAEFPGVAADPPVRLRAEVLTDRLTPPASHYSGDIALLRLAAVPPVETAVLHRRVPKRGEPVHCVGYPAQRPGGAFVNARLMGLGGPGRHPEWVQLDPAGGSYAVRHGFSGSGVVHTGSGEVLGILVHRYGTDDYPVAVSHAYMIPTETILRYLSAGRLDELKVTGPTALSPTIPRGAPMSGSNRALGLRRKVTHWLIDSVPATRTTGTAAVQVPERVSAPDPAPGRRAATEPVELIFARDERHDDMWAIHATLNLADRERNPRPTGSGDATEPPAGSIDIAVDTTGLTAGQLIDLTAERIGLTGPGEVARQGGPAGRAGPDEHADPEKHDRVLARITRDSPPITVAFLSVDRTAPTGEAALPLLQALRAGGQSRLLLVFRDPASPLLERVVDTLLDDGWAERRTKAVAARLAALVGLERRFRRLRAQPGAAHIADAPPPVYRQLAARLAELRPDDGAAPRKSATLAYDLFLIDIAVEDAIQRTWSAVLLLAPGEYVVKPPRDGLTALPHITVDNPDTLVDPEAEALTKSRSPLVPGQELHQQYRVVGLLGEGSFGQVYLAHDKMLDDRPVALKGPRDRSDATARIARLELVRLVRLNHPSIIKVFNYARHPGRPEEPGDESNQARFIVMEFADGAPLQWVAEQIAREEPPFDGYRVHEFIASYGVLILNALSYLHNYREDGEKGFVYGDLSLTNVIHCRDGIKLIDVASVRKIGDAGPFTYRAPELADPAEVTVAADLFAVGEVLQELLDRVPPHMADLGTTSLQHVVQRARAARPEGRFADAQEMAVQLQGVLRELRSLRLGEETFEPSPLFSPAPAALDGELGKAPPLEQWRYGGNGKRPLTIGPPKPAEVSVGLPVPKASRQDINWKELQRTSYDDPAGLLQLSADWQLSPELALLRCRLHLEVARYQPADRAGGCLASATAELRRAEVAVGALAAYDWRLRWHQGLLHLAGDDVTSARRFFAEVYAAIPGEFAPKLALGYCHEVLGDLEEAMVFYRAVWERNHALGSAAFGLARIHLADGDSGSALARLEAVPGDSRHRTAARTGMVRIHADLPAGGGPPTVDTAKQAYEALHRLDRYEGLTDQHAQERLHTDLLELLLRLVKAAAEPDPLGELREALDKEIPIPLTEHELREQLGTYFEQLSKQVPPTDPDERTSLDERPPLEWVLLDNAYHTRPFGFSHNRGKRRQGPWRGWRPRLLRGRRTDRSAAPDAGERERERERDAAATGER